MSFQNDKSFLLESFVNIVDEKQVVMDISNNQDFGV